MNTTKVFSLNAFNETATLASSSYAAASLPSALNGLVYHDVTGKEETSSDASWCHKER